MGVSGRRQLFLLGCAVVFLLGGCSLLVGDFSVTEDDEVDKNEREDGGSIQDGEGQAEDDAEEFFMAEEDIVVIEFVDGDLPGYEEAVSENLAPEWCTSEINGHFYKDRCWIYGQTKCESVGLTCASQTPKNLIKNDQLGQAFLSSIASCPSTNYTYAADCNYIYCLPNFISGPGNNCFWMLFASECGGNILCNCTLGLHPLIPCTQGAP